MFKRKLQALHYPAADNFDVNDKKAFRRLILWLEIEKIKHYKIKERRALWLLESESWPQAFAKYKTDIACPRTIRNATEELHWILAYAVRLECDAKKDKYRKAEETMVNPSVPNITHSNTFDGMDLQSEDFKDGVDALAEILKISPHSDHLVTLEAIREVVCNRQYPEALQNMQGIIVNNVVFSYEEIIFGVDVGDPVLNKAAKILRLLCIQNLRDLQSSINNIIVKVQNTTVDAKTDSGLNKLGK